MGVPTEIVMQTVLRIWLLGSAVMVAAVIIWTFVPVLVPIIGLTAVIGAVVAVVVCLARGLGRLKGNQPGEPG
jgi:hypothetical protein